MYSYDICVLAPVPAYGKCPSPESFSCPLCGDSNESHAGHLSVARKGLVYSLRPALWVGIGLCLSWEPSPSGFLVAKGGG